MRLALVFFCAGCLRPCVPTADAAAIYSITDLGTLPGFSTMIGSSMNSSGQVVGVAVSTTGDLDGFVWRNGNLTDIGTALGLSTNIVFDINDDGEIAGGYDGIDEHLHAFTCINGQKTDLGALPGGTDSVACGINGSGSVVGLANNSTGEVHAVLWQNDQIADLGTLAGQWSVAFRINSSGTAVGFATDPNSIAALLGGNPASGLIAVLTGSATALSWQNGQIAQLPPLPGATSAVAVAINDLGQIVGQSSASIVGTHAVLWQSQQAAATDLGTLPPYHYCAALSINNVGQIVGVSFDLDHSGSVVPGRAVVWRNGQAVDLNTLIPSQLGRLAVGRDGHQ